MSILLLLGGHFGGITDIISVSVTKCDVIIVNGIIEAWFVC